MSATATTTRFVFARAAVRATGVLHLAAVRSTGAIVPTCGARHITSAQVEVHDTQPADVPLCDNCTTFAAGFGGIDALTSARAGRFLDVHVDRIDAPDDYARRTPGAGIDDLVDSVRERGIIVPIIARRTDTGYLIVDGARRYYAATITGHTTVPVIITDGTDSDALLDTLTANLHRADLSPIEQAHAYQRALDTIPALRGNKAELGRRLGISREQISNTIRLLQLEQIDQDRIAAGELTAQQGRAILAGGQGPARKLTPPQLDANELAVLDQVSATLRDLLAAKVHVAPVAGDRRRITIDVPEQDLARILSQLGVQAAAA